MADCLLALCRQEHKTQAVIHLLSRMPSMTSSSRTRWIWRSMVTSITTPGESRLPSNSDCFCSLCKLVRGMCPLTSATATCLPFDCRSCPLYRQACQPNNADGSAAATVFVNTGHAGASLGYDIETTNLGIFESVSISHGYTRATVNKTTFTLEVCFTPPPPTLPATRVSPRLSLSMNAGSHMCT